MSVIAGLAKNDFGDLIDAVNRSDSIIGLQESVNKISVENGFPMHTYHMISAAGLPKPLVTHFSSYPKDWVAHYIEDGLFFRDPVVHRASDAVSPFAWADLLNNETPEEARDFLNEANAAGISGGLSIPIRGPQDFALFSVCAGENERESNALIRHSAPYMTILGMAVHERARKLYQPLALDAGGIKDLSPRQREIMQWIARGKSAWDISRIIGISEARVRHASAFAFEKLGCRDRTHAAIRAVLLGMIEPPS